MVDVIMDPIRSSSTMGRSRGETPSWALLAAMLAIGYAMGSASTSGSLGSIGRATWKGIKYFEGWVHEVLVPIYMVFAVVYLLIHRYDRYQSGKERPTDSQSPERQEQDNNGGEKEESKDVGEKPIDMTGIFKVVENNNFGEFLKAQGVPWFLCNAASKARPTHHFTHQSPLKLTIQIRGIIESETSYQIGGPYTETTIRGRVFKDSLSYLYDKIPQGEVEPSLPPEESNNDGICVGVKTRKIAVGEGYEVHVERRIIRSGATWVPTPEENPDGHCTYDLETPCDFDRLLMTNKVVYEEGRNEEPVIASQLFHRTD